MQRELEKSAGPLACRRAAVRIENELRLNLNFIPADLLADGIRSNGLFRCLPGTAWSATGMSLSRRACLNTVRGVTKACGAGGGCLSCHRHIKRMLHEHAAQRRLTAPAEMSVEAVLDCA
jgi:bacterioferritin-associated ferredoxin